MVVPVKVSTAALQRAKKKKVTWSITDLDQEILWRTWFPVLGGTVDWNKDLSSAEVDPLFDGCVRFIEDCLSIRVPGRGRQPLRLRDAQKDVLREWVRCRRTVSLKARQIGFSTLAAAYVLWLAFGWPDRFIVMLSRTERESIKLLSKVKYNYRYMPEWVKLRGPKLLDRKTQAMTFDNESSIESLPSANDPARGESVFLVVVDEWAFLPSPEDAWAAIEPITDIGGRVMGISTAKGEGNFFHKLWLGSQSGDNTFTGVFFPWWSVDGRDEVWYAQKQKDLEPWQICQEYPSTPEEAFVGSGNPVFNLDILRRMKSEVPGEFTISAEGRSSVIMLEGGPFQVWETPNDKLKHTYVVGVDIAMGLEHGDMTVAWVLCVNTGEPVAVWFGRVEPDVFGEKILPAIGWYYRHAVIAPEVNNHGLTVLKALQRAGYQRIYRRRTFTKRQDRPLESMGWLTTATSKPLLVDELAGWLRTVDNIPHGRTVAELRAFTRDSNGRMSGSPHDDCVIALGIAVQARKYALTEKIGGETSPEKIKGSFAWFDRQLDRKLNRGRRVSNVI